MADAKDFNHVKADFVTSLLESINGLSRVKAEQRLSSVFCDPWNKAEQEVRKLPVKVRDEKGL